MRTDLKHIINSYENYNEEDRLTTNKSRRIEFVTTIRALNDILPSKGKLLDCAAGTGIYAFYFADRGYDVTALDITPRHIEIINRKLEAKSIDMITAVNDATNLSSFCDESFDIVLCMGPIYHLTDKKMRQKCINECTRVLKKEGYLVVTYINRFFVFPYIATNNKKYLNMEFATKLMNTGCITHDDPNCFWTDSYYAIPEILEQDLKRSCLKVIDHLATDGLSLYLKEVVDNMSKEEFNVWCDYHYSVCRERSILGASNHGLVICQKGT